MVSLKVHDKALVLIERGDVSLELVHGSRVMATVVSFDGLDTYSVWFFRGCWRCDCLSHRACSHIHAVQLVTDGTATSAVPGQPDSPRFQRGGRS
jgi:hypothetical protein